MENNGKGTGIFYGVIGVATLIITIIGATFAYFSATTNSDVDAVTAAGATITLGYVDIDTGLKTDLIPIDPELEEFDEGVVGIATNKCKDINGNNICSVYQFTVSNTSTVSQRIFGNITPKTNTFANLKLAVFKGTSADVDANTDVYWDVDGTAVEDLSETAMDAARKNIIGDNGDLVFSAYSVPTVSEGQTGAAIDIDAFEQVLDPQDSVTYTIVMWINETHGNQDVDQGKTFAAGVNFTTEGNGTGVTGVLSTSSQ